MRLKPRNIKRLMFACTQCGQCIDACHTVQRDHPEGSLLNWIADEQALQADGSQGLLVSEPPTQKPKTALLATLTTEAVMLDREELTTPAAEFAEAKGQALKRAEQLQ